jgi:hypothetical protein
MAFASFAAKSFAADDGDELGTEDANGDCAKEGLMRLRLKASKYNDVWNASDIEHPIFQLVYSARRVLDLRWLESAAITH